MNDIMDFKAIREFTEDLSVLVCDDDNDALQQLVRILERFFGNVISAKDGAQGREIYMHTLNEAPIDLIVTDIQMPLLDGLSMIRDIRAVVPQQKVVIISAYNELKYFSEAIELGVDGFIIKPVKLEQLFSLVYKVSQSIILQRENTRYRDYLEQLVEERTSAIQRLWSRDPLTGLWNQAHLLQKLTSDAEFHILLVNIDNFVHINSSFGYTEGDKLLKKIGVWFEAVKPDGWEVFRIGSDEFVLVSDKELTEGDVIDIGEGIRKGFSAVDWEICDFKLRMTITTGISCGKGEQLLQQASTALKQARDKGKNRSFFYKLDSAIEERQRETILWINNLRAALDGDRLIPVFQGIVNNNQGSIEKYESLARIANGNGLILPGRFMGPAKISGMLPEITRVMVARTLSVFRQRTEEVSMNISEEDFKDGYLVDFLLSQTMRHPEIRHRLTLEILEEISVTGSEGVLQQIKHLQEAGFKIALDDFGSEKSNFGRLKDLNIDILKIDGIFVRNVDVDENSRVIVQAITALAHNLGAKVVAEFVHSESVQSVVKELGVDYSQGFYLHKPGFL